MEKLGRKIVRFRIPIFIIGLLLLIPSVFGYINTRVNYDVLYYLPDSIETMQGQDILVDEFGTGAYSMFICEGMENKDVAKLKEQIEKYQCYNEQEEKDKEEILRHLCESAHIFNKKQ